MKKIISYLLCVVVLLSTVCVNASNSVDIEELVVADKYVAYTEEFDMSFEIDGLDYYPFIYHASNEWFIDNVIGQTTCQEGYLYSKNLNSGQIIKLVSQPVDIYRSTEYGLYFIYSNSIFLVDYNGNNMEKIYESNGVLNTNILEVDNDYIYFCEGNKIVKYDLDSERKSVVALANNVDMLYIKSNDEIVYQNNNEIHYVNSSVNNNVDTVVSKESEVFNLFAYKVENGISPIALSAPTDTNLNSVRSSYPSGSYFTTTGTKCVNHNHCKTYGGGTQCMGYARWAFDTYAHLSSWSSHAESENDNDVNFSDNADVLAFFSGCYVGAYVRLKRSGSGNYGFHSLFYAGRTSSTITTYECNYGGECEVKYYTRSLSSIRSIATGVTKYVTHDYGSNSTYAISYNSTYHKQYCMVSNCPAYRYEQHYNPISGSSKCTACGYSGTISYTSPLN